MGKVLFAKVKENAIIPSKERYNAGYDIYACFDEDFIIIEPHQTKLVPTGIASIIPEDYYIHIYERGSTGSKGIKSSAGVIDSSYRGEWFMAVTNINTKPLIIGKKEYFDKIEDKLKHLYEKEYIIYPYEKAIFQGIVHKVHNQLEVEEISIEELEKDTTPRGKGSLGSSNK